MNQYRFEFQGKGFEYFLYILGWGVLLTITVGITTPFFIVWNFKWFTKNLIINKEAK